MFNIQCLDSRTEENNFTFAQFSIGPIKTGDAITIGSALRRTLLSNLKGLAIVGVRIAGVNHEFFRITNTKEDVIEILLNLKQVILKGEHVKDSIARVSFKGPGIITTQDIQFSDTISVVNSQQYIAQIVDETNFEMELLIDEGQGYTMSNNLAKTLPDEFLPIDAVFMPVKRVNFFVETALNELSLNEENLIMEITTDGSQSPMDALSSAASLLEQAFGKFNTTETGKKTFVMNDSSEPISIEKEFDNVMIEELELSVRAYNCLKRANINTLSNLLNYSLQDLLEFKNFGQKSADEVCEQLKIKFGKSLK
jgi:DNA-directed RNA polymerase subunit alpha|tara:strand:+ start:23654 stop:24586 length:933 start_codon:yes stop_codon:yes gene_type:complete